MDSYISVIKKAPTHSVLSQSIMHVIYDTANKHIFKKKTNKNSKSDCLEHHFSFLPAGTNFAILPTESITKDYEKSTFDFFYGTDPLWKC